MPIRSRGDSRRLYDPNGFSVNMEGSRADPSLRQYTPELLAHEQMIANAISARIAAAQADRASIADVAIGGAYEIKMVK